MDDAGRRWGGINVMHRQPDGTVSRRVRAVTSAVLVTLGTTACGARPSTTGAPGPARPQRSIAIVAGDQLRFTPAAVTVHPGETVAFVVTNSGALSHEFVIGDAQRQDEHEQQMRHMRRAMDMSAEPGTATVAPGGSATVVYTFPRSGTLLFGCHVPGHFGAGMRGSITVG